MGKAKRTKAKQRPRPSRRIVVISALEIGHHNAMVTLRGGRSDHDSTPLRIVMPSEQPWQPHAVPGPRKEEAAKSLQKMWADFLAREPFIRPDRNNLDIDGNQPDGEEPGESEFDDDADEDCPRCEASRDIGGILCVCGHDWSCHDSSLSKSEPCSHCSCEDMREPDDPPAT